MRTYLVSSLAHFCLTNFRPTRLMGRFLSPQISFTKRYPTIRRPVNFSLYWAFVGVGSYGFAQHSVSRAACQKAVFTDDSMDPPAATVSYNSLSSLLTEQLKFWHHVLETLASNLVYGILVSFRFIKNSVLFGPLLFSYPLAWLFPDTFQDLWLSTLLRVIELSGPTYVKLGQWASTRRDIFRPNFCNQLSKLHRNAPSHSLEYTKRALQHAFGALWREVFQLEVTTDGRDCSVYSGCVGQVHKGYMRRDLYEAVMEGRPKGLKDWTKVVVLSRTCEWVPVAIKVLHPGILESVDLDLRIIHMFAKILNLVPGLHWLSLSGLVKEFETLMKNQVDLKVEAENLQKFHRNFSDVPYVKTPQPIWPFVTDQVLVETYEEGESILTFVSSFEKSPEDIRVKKCLAKMGIDVLLKMVFVDNFVHADLHPGNMLVQGVEKSMSLPRRMVQVLDHADEFQVCLEEAPSPLCLVLLDTGIIAQLDEKDFSNFFQVFSAIVLCKGDAVAELFIEHASSNACKDIDKFKADMSDLVARAHQQTLQLGKMQVGQLLSDLFSMMIRHKVKLESNFASIILAIMVLEGLGRSLDPQLDILEAAKPVILGKPLYK
ncbi:uncharacterized aarF domain-containing protein kinase 2-like [Diadema setosum]|uniref:uncharacterized aarF domain-containing protein kinase 2-like n=1 Tax=Diadema setosum TaxID=31175 RepID=UPI003B3BA38B